MLYWLSKEDQKRIRGVLDSLESLLESDRACTIAHRGHESAQQALDADMSNLWDKVNHALARIGGRAKKSSQEPVEASGNGPSSVEALNDGIMKGEVTQWPLPLA